MTLNQLKKVDSGAALKWEADGFLTAEQVRRTLRFYQVKGKLYAVWNNGCFYEAFRYGPKGWVSLATKGSRAFRAKYYQQGCKTLSRLDKKGIYG